MVIVISNFVILWIVGVLLSLGIFLAIRDKNVNLTLFLGIAWVVLFSYAFFAWMLGKLIQLLYIEDKRVRSTYKI